MAASYPKTWKSSWQRASRSVSQRILGLRRLNHAGGAGMSETRQVSVDITALYLAIRCKFSSFLEVMPVVYRYVQIYI
jgi:hypothetical protein